MLRYSRRVAYLYTRGNSSGGNDSFFRVSEKN